MRTPTSDLGLDTTGLTGPQRDTLVIRWRPLATAAEFRLVASFTIARVNASDPSCGKPLLADTRTIAVDERVPGTATSIAAALPAQDAWLVGAFTLDLTALGSDGVGVGGQARQGVFEGAGACTEPTTSPPSMLPSTGLGGDPARDRTDVTWIVAMLAAAILPGVTLVSRLRR